MEISLRLLDFNVYNEEVPESESDSENEIKKYVDNKVFIIQIFGLNEKGETFSIFIDDFKPFFYIKVDDDWNNNKKMLFLDHLKTEVGGYYKKSILECKLVKKHKLYGFDNNKEYKFIFLKFKNVQAMNKVKNLFYENLDGERKLKKNGYKFLKYNLKLYEANIPPLLRFFHIKNISPSGWINIPKSKLEEHYDKVTKCKFEYTCSYKDIISVNNKELKVPYKICSFDIEASSSHGDFPLAKKNYKKLANNIIEYWNSNNDLFEDYSMEDKKNIFRTLVLSAFGYGNEEYVDLVYPKKQPNSEEEVLNKIDIILSKNIKELLKDNKITKNDIHKYLCDNNENSDDEDNPFQSYKYMKNIKINTNSKVIELLDNYKIPNENKLIELTKILDSVLPQLKGDMVTFIGSTFIKYGQNEPYLNHCIALGDCNEVNGATIECYDTEKKLLLAWTKLIEKEDPDIIIGYNIFGFDYKFMFERAQEIGGNCVNKFLNLSRNKDEICGKRDKNSNEIKIEETSITIASGTHNLSFIKMNGRIQIDLYNYFRREYNLTSYKLDYVSGHFIGDKVNKLEHNNNQTIIHSRNLTGLKEGNYIHFEEIGHSSEYYKNGEKFEVIKVNNNNFVINSEEYPDNKKIIKWCLAKDDVSPQDIFRMSNEGPQSKAIIAKYCIQDCNLVHHLLNKIDVMTGFIEMASICCVPIDFLVMRGQGIKLFSFIAKKCREVKTLIPVIEKKNDGGYEGAIVLDPKCGLYLDEPVACVDYSSLYPSSMISENLSHDSKVWTKEYDLNDNLTKETGIKDNDGNFVYDNLEGYKYVDVTYDMYEYLHHCKMCDYKVSEEYKYALIKHSREKHGKELKVIPASEKTKVGKKTCRFAQFPNNKLAIMPTILKDLLAARKQTRTSARYKTIKTSIGDYTGLILEKTVEHITLKDKDGKIKIIEKESIRNIEDTYNDFMKNVLDKRQLAIKVTANSLYGQCGAKTSSFYEKDVAASTTATGRKLLTYGKRIIEEVYGDRICETSYGKVHSHAEYIYGDSVLGDTPIILKNKKTCNIITKQIMDLCNKWDNYEEFKPFDTYRSNRHEKEQSKIEDYEVWSKSGWSKIKRVIRHKCNKKIYRVNTSDGGIIDITEDHSLLNKEGNILKPTQAFIGQELLVNSNLVNELNKLDIENIDKQLYSTKNTNYKIEKSIKYLYNLNTNYSYRELKCKITSIELLYKKYQDFVYDIETEDGTFNCGFSAIIKNTDSVFMSFKLTDPETGEKIVGKEALKHTIELAKDAGKLATKFLKAPHDLEYEKTFMPFCLLSKKRYVGMLYEEDPNKCFRKSMGIVLKRRDNAPIVKDVYGGIIDILMKEQNVSNAIKFTKKCLDDIVNEKYPLDKLIITKSLRGFYKNPLQIAHKVLADRMGKRDPGNKPGPGDRIPFVYIQTKGRVKLQGDKVEHPEHIKKNKLKPDYSYYITNQIMKPVQQLFGLVLEDIPLYKKKLELKRKVRAIRRQYKDNPKKLREQEQKYRNNEVKSFIFDEALHKCENIKNNQKSILSFFK